ncbi:CinA family protein, partial [Streptomyces sp. NPDC059597]|uniref:CinA family protein n=1 Tax=Streptomyces sp. NPDC059597 TaxID=3346879 RepID=UPI003675C868
MTTTATELVRLLTVSGETLAVAESLTGGLVAADITSVPGASRVFRGSVTAYATELKHRLLGVEGARAGRGRGGGAPRGGRSGGAGGRGPRGRAGRAPPP